MIHNKIAHHSLLLLASSTLILSAQHVAAVTPQDLFTEIGENLEAGIENVEQRPFSSDGLLSCEAGNYGSVGKAHAGGVFVPVSEEAVALNTNINIFKECILDPIAGGMSESMITFMTRATFNALNNNPDGTAGFVTNQSEFRLTAAQKVVDEFTTGAKTEGILPVVRDNIRYTLANNYKRSVLKPESVYTHSVPDDKQAEFAQFMEGNGRFTWEMYGMLMRPENNPMSIYAESLTNLLTDVSQKIEDENRELEWGQGFKSQKNCKQIPVGNGLYEEFCEITTPGATIKSVIDYVSLTGHRQTENADEINELMGSLVSNIHTQILTSVGGLRGLTQAGSGTSYVDQIVGDASTRTRAEYTNAGTSLLDTVIDTETAYGTARKASSDTLGATALQIEAREEVCWTGLIDRAKIDTLAEAEALACAVYNHQQNNNINLGANNNTCSIQGSATVVHASSTSATAPLSHEVTITAIAGNKTVTRVLIQHDTNSFDTIAQNISPLLKVVNQSVADSENALSILERLQASLALSNTAGNTRFILGQVDQLVAAGALHKEADIYTAQNQNEQISDTMTDLYDETIDAWNTSWCSPTNWRDQIK